MKISRLYLSLIFWVLTFPLFSQDPGNPSDILERIDTLIEEEVNDWCDSAGISYPPDATLLRVFKREKKMQIWAKNANMEKMKLIITIPICAMDFEPGPKFQQGDGKTPEGFYTADFLYGSRFYWMWIKLEKEKVNNVGQVKNGSSFRICIDYPNEIDRNKSSIFNLNTGGGICIHGNCVTAGCISFSNWNFLPVFAFSKHHNSEQFGKLQIHIFPFDFDHIDSLQDEAENYAGNSYFSKEQLLLFWVNLKEGFDRFNNQKNPFNFSKKTFLFRSGNRSPKIVEIKKKLHVLSLFNEDISPVFDNELEAAIRVFQEQHNLTVDGIIGAKTLAAMELLTAKYVFIGR